MENTGQPFARGPLGIQELDRAFANLSPFPKDQGTVLDLCVRPGPDQREPRESIELSPEHGAVGDRWIRKTWMYLPDGRPDPRVQTAVCNLSILRLIQALTGCRHHPGDTIFTDLDLSHDNLPCGTRLRIGEAVLEVSDVENDACAKFAIHYGQDVFDWIRHPANRHLRLRGLFAQIIQPGVVRLSDQIRRV